MWLIGHLLVAALVCSSRSYQSAGVSAAQEPQEFRTAPVPNLLCEPIICATTDYVHLDNDDLTCGSNGIFYDSLCAFENAKCEDPGLERVHIGACTSSVATHAKKKRCDLQCADNLVLICASDGITYQNACRLEEAYCRDQTIGPVHYGECDGQ